MIARTPQPPYYAVIFTSVKAEVESGYADTAKRMVELANQQEGFLGMESARDEVGITVSYWADLDSIKKWKLHAEHSIARERGRKEWYEAFKVRICKVERDYGMNVDEL